MVSIDRVPRTAGESRWPAAIATLVAVGLYGALPERAARRAALHHSRHRARDARDRGDRESDADDETDAPEPDRRAQPHLPHHVLEPRRARASVAPSGFRRHATAAASCCSRRCRSGSRTSSSSRSRSGNSIEAARWCGTTAPGWRCRSPTSASRRTRIATRSSRSRRAPASNSGWLPHFIDYAYVSLTNSSAFSPTDTMPLSSRAKILMGTESAMALITSVVVIAKGVGSLH